MRDQSRRATRFCTTLARLPHGCTLEHNSDAVIPEAQCRPGSPMPRGERIAQPAGWGDPRGRALVLCLQAEAQRASDPLAQRTKSDLSRNHVSLRSEALDAPWAGPVRWLG